jgi:hypothetical protein
MACNKHNWVLLYREPINAEFKAMYRKDRLNSYLICDQCAKIARKFRLTSHLRILGVKRAAANLKRARKWNGEVA